MENTDKIICPNCQSEDPSTAKFCSACGHDLTKKGHAHWIFVDTFLKIGEIGNYAKEYTKTFLSPYRTTVRNFEERTFTESLKFLEFSVGVSALFIFSSAISIEGQGIISGLLNTLLFLITWSAFFLVFYFIAKRSVKAKKRTYTEFIEISSWILGFTLPLSYILVWLLLSTVFIFVADVYKILALTVLLGYFVYLLIYIARAWKYFWELSTLEIFWRYILSVLVAVTLNYALTAGINAVSGAKPGYSQFLEEKVRRYQNHMAIERSRVAITTEKVTLRTITELVSANGRFFHQKEIKIAAEVSGEIIELYVKEGETVAAGQILAKIRPDEYRSAVERAQTDLASAREQLESSVANLKKAYGTNLAGARENVRMAELLVAGAQAKLQEMRASLQKTVFAAPVSGIVSKLNIEKGERVVGTRLMSGTEMFHIAKDGDMMVQAEIAESDISKIRIGQEADIEVEAYPDRKFKGHVTQVAASSANAGMFSSDHSKTYIVEISITPESYYDLTKSGKSYPFTPDMAALIEINTASVQNTLSVPIIAITTRGVDTTALPQQPQQSESSNGKTEFNPYGPEEYVFVVSGDSVLMTAVRTGIQNNDHIQILSGLNEGQEIVTGPYSTISKKLNNRTKIKKI